MSPLWLTISIFYTYIVVGCSGQVPAHDNLITFFHVLVCIIPAFCCLYLLMHCMHSVTVQPLHRRGVAETAEKPFMWVNHVTIAISHPIDVQNSAVQYLHSQYNGLLNWKAGVKHKYKYVPKRSTFWHFRKFSYKGIFRPIKIPLTYIGFC